MHAEFEPATAASGFVGQRMVRLQDGRSCGRPPGPSAAAAHRLAVHTMRVRSLLAMALLDGRRSEIYTPSINQDALGTPGSAGRAGINTRLRAVKLDAAMPKVGDFEPAPPARIPAHSAGLRTAGNPNGRTPCN